MNVYEFRRLMKGRQKGGRQGKGGSRRKRDEIPPEQEMDMQFRAAGVRPWVMQHRFHPTRKWRLDFAWPELLVALEVHGAVWTSGHHVQGQGFTDDREKMSEAACLGWLVIEATTDQVRSGAALDWVERALAHAVSRLAAGEAPAP